ncbi:MAG: Flp family type IVb pilin [Bdellovibrionales bacterium]|nr:Flp family type IVb pilin [Bdellovibrionales bacterium]
MHQKRVDGKMNEKTPQSKHKVLLGRRGQKGATMIEYSLVAAIMVTGLITGVYLLRQNMSQTFSKVGSAVNTQ